MTTSPSLIDSIFCSNKLEFYKTNDTIRNNMLEKLACLRRARAIFPAESSFPRLVITKAKYPIFKQRLLVGFRGLFMF
jgi:hypothetical protein